MNDEDASPPGEMATEEDVALAARPSVLVYLSMPRAVGRLTYEAVNDLARRLVPAGEQAIVTTHGMTLRRSQLADGRVVGKPNRLAVYVTYAIVAADADGMLSGEGALELDYFARRSRRCREVAVIDENGVRLGPAEVATILDAFDLGALPEVGR